MYLTLLRLVLVLTALFTIPISALVLAASPWLREWFSGFILFPLLNEPADAIIANKKRALFKENGVKGRVMDLGSGLGSNFKHYRDLKLEITKSVTATRMRVVVWLSCLHDLLFLEALHA